MKIVLYDLPCGADGEIKGVLDKTIGLAKKESNKEYQAEGVNVKMDRIVFNNEECVIINSICAGEKQETLTRDYLLNSLQNTKAVLLAGALPVDGNELSDTDLIYGIIDRLNAMEDAEWDDMKLLLPFPVPWTPEDEDFDLEEDGI